ncbi:virion protein [Fowlpox virus]|uniref:ORF FPV148 Virion protein n=2 Tax=Fowlpox virus TaxID=10261 RepID=Q9J582_FOWPN|nr:Virion protein [Fowlpox virus]UNS14364.1 ALPV-200 [Albatrosspox virus]WPD90855.1 D2-like virion protein [Avipoxvirus sp.]CAE52687.1 D2L virion protein orthologue [Fowlpox virus isolate HP-438/Munich]AAF44492.1 ORF FPV148 Virion protein [Fowlpox virus]ART91581.1 D2L virion protein ortholog [Fowlpox virus]
MELELKSIGLINIHTLFNKVIRFQQDINNILKSDYIIVSFCDNGKLFEIYNFDKVARFDNGIIYQQIKNVYKDRHDYLPVIFPSQNILESFNEEFPIRKESSTLRIPSANKHPKMILLELFNSFKTNKVLGCCYYYTRP